MANMTDTKYTATYNKQYVTRFNRVFGSKLTTMVHAISRVHDWDNFDTRLLLTEMEELQNKCEAYESHGLFIRPIYSLSEQDKQDVFQLFDDLEHFVNEMAEYIDDNFDSLQENWRYVTSPSVQVVED